MDMMAGTVLYRENETIRSYKNRDSLVDVGCLGWLLLIGSRVAFSLPSNLVDGQSPLILLSYHGVVHISVLVYLLLV